MSPVPRVPRVPPVSPVSSVPPLILLQSLSFCIGKLGGSQETEAVLADINLSINSGEAIACLGKNGSGKTTLLKLMAGLLEPTAGKILFNGDQVVSNTDLLGSRITWVSSAVDKYFVGATVQEDMEFGLLQIGLSASEVSRKVNQVLEQYELEDFRYLPPFDLDAVAKRRLVFASAVITEPALILIDELLSGLNEAENFYFARKIKELTGSGCAVIRVTQNVSEIMDYQRAIVLAGNTIVADGNPGDIFCDPVRIAGWGLNIPVALTISSELCRDGLLRQPVFAADELVRAISNGYAGASAGVSAEASASAPAQVHAQSQLLIRPGTSVLLTGRSQTALAGAAENIGTIVRFEGMGMAGAQKKPVVAFLPRNPEELLIESTVWKEITFGLKMAEGADARAAEALQLCGLDPARYSWRDPRTLSLGEQRRVAMAAVLALSPECICLEDPLEGLDAEGWESLTKILEMSKARGAALLMVSADIDHIWKHAEAVYLLDSGQLLGPADCDPDQIIALLAGSQSCVAWDLPEDLRLWQYLRQMGIAGVGADGAKSVDGEEGADGAKGAEDSTVENGGGNYGNYWRGHFTQTMLDALRGFLRGGQRKAGDVGDVPDDRGKAGNGS